MIKHSRNLQALQKAEILKAPDVQMFDIVASKVPVKIEFDENNSIIILIVTNRPNRAVSDLLTGRLGSASSRRPLQRFLSGCFCLNICK